MRTYAVDGRPPTQHGVPHHGGFDAGFDDIAGFFRQVMDEDSQHARRCHEFLRKMSGSDETGPGVT
ncbi:MAG: hypothetical protein M3332_10110 [Actinomycetota bacterium]|nr:hypothetical protein [Actinomycetota bacterium]